MIKINFIGLKDGGKSLSCFLLAKFFSKKNKTLILNIDLFSKYGLFLKKNLVTKKIEWNNKTIKLMPVNGNLDLLDLNINPDLQDNLENLIEYFSNSYEVIIIDNLVALPSININIIHNSNFIISPFKIGQDILSFKNKVLDLFLSNSINSSNFKFLPLLSNNNTINMNEMLKLRKQLSSLLFDISIPYCEFKKYSDLAKNTKLLNQYNLVFEEIKNKIEIK